MTDLPPTNPTAAVLVIGNEILSGRTQDANVQFIAQRLAAIGITLCEVRVIPDVAETIIATVNALRAAFDQVFTTGGIGPTHDDITSPSVAEAFGVPWEPHEPTMQAMSALFPGDSFNAPRRRMATLPLGAIPIENRISVAPGFSIGNVHVLAGVPKIMRAMFESLEPRLGHYQPVLSTAVHVDQMLEGTIAEGLERIQQAFPQLDIGSYPYESDGHRGVTLVAKGKGADDLAAARQAIVGMITEVGHIPLDGESPG